jgi:hypothetical protein
MKFSFFQYRNDRLGFFVVIHSFSEEGKEVKGASWDLIPDRTQCGL